MNKQMVIVAAACAIMPFAGCKMTRVCGSTGGMEVAQTEGGRATIRVDDPCFNEWLSVEGAVLRRTGSGFLQAGVNIRNFHTDPCDHDREDDFDMQYRFSWFDGDGMDVSADAAHWTSVTIHGGGSVQLQSTAPTAAAVKYVMRMRHIRKINKMEVK